MKYLMARDAGVKAAEYVIQQWPELFPSRDISPVSSLQEFYEFVKSVALCVLCRTLDPKYE